MSSKKDNSNCLPKSQPECPPEPQCPPQQQMCPPSQQSGCQPEFQSECPQEPMCNPEPMCPQDSISVKVTVPKTGDKCGPEDDARNTCPSKKSSDEGKKANETCPPKEPEPPKKLCPKKK